MLKITSSVLCLLASSQQVRAAATVDDGGRRFVQVDGKPNEEIPEDILKQLHGDPNDQTSEADLYNMNDETLMPNHDDAEADMPDWAKGLNDGDEVKMDFDMSEDSFKNNDGSGAWESTGNKYDLEEANAFIRMSDNGKIDQEYFENYILPADETTVKFEQTWFISLMHSGCKKEACDKLNDFHEQLFLVWLGETMVKPVNVEDQLKNVGGNGTDETLAEMEALSQNPDKPLMEHNGTDDAAIPGEDNYFEKDPVNSMYTFKIGMVDCALEMDTICKRILTPEQKLPKFMILHGNKAYKWHSELDYFMVEPYLTKLEFLTKEGVEQQELKKGTVKLQENEAKEDL